MTRKMPGNIRRMLPHGHRYGLIYMLKYLEVKQIKDSSEINNFITLIGKFNSLYLKKLKYCSTIGF